MCSVPNTHWAQFPPCLTGILPGGLYYHGASWCLTLCPVPSPVGVAPGRCCVPPTPDPDPDPLGWAAAPRPSWEPHPDFSLACTVCLVSRLFAPTTHSVDAHLGLVPTSGPAAMTTGGGCPEGFTVGPLQEGGLFLHSVWFPLWSLNCLEMKNVLIVGP